MYVICNVLSNMSVNFRMSFVIILKFLIKWHMQTLQTQIRLLFEGLHCLQFH